ncbi:Shikimate O-hydroxycinnamoyltransferase [Bertholletia excelsa]
MGPPSPLDRASQVGLVFLKPTASQLKQLLAGTVIDHLKISLSRTLDFFHPLAGRLAVIQNDDGTSSFFIDCNNAGVHFIHSIAHGTTVRDILDPGFVPRIVSSFFPLNGSLNCEGLSNPLLAVQVTELVDGFFIGCTMNHVVVDGTSFYHFLSSWSEIARGMEVVSQPPILKRWFPSDIQPPIRIPLNLQELELDAYRLPPPQFRERVFHFTKEKIAELKEKANFEMGTHRISSLQALAAHMWRSIMLCKGISEDQETTYIILIDSRARLQPPLPENYFGNAVYDVGFTTKVGLLVGKGPSRAALEMSSTKTSRKTRKPGVSSRGGLQIPGWPQRPLSPTTFSRLLARLGSMYTEMTWVGGGLWQCVEACLTCVMGR